MRFHDFLPWIIGGGTTAGLGGLAALARAYAKPIRDMVIAHLAIKGSPPEDRDKIVRELAGVIGPSEQPKPRPRTSRSTGGGRRNQATSPPSPPSPLELPAASPKRQHQPEDQQQDERRDRERVSHEQVRQQVE